MAEFLKPKKTNPRGIPEAPFIEKVEDVIKHAELEFGLVLGQFQERLQQYKYMEASKRQQLSDLQMKIPDIEKNLDVIAHIQARKLKGDETPMETNFELNETLYARASVDAAELGSVCLWLGAEVMLEYPLDEAVEMLNERLVSNQTQLKLVKEDLDFLKENITTMEVNTARLYNWDVERRKRAQVGDDVKNLKID